MCDKFGPGCPGCEVCDLYHPEAFHPAVRDAARPRRHGSPATTATVVLCPWCKTRHTMAQACQQAGAS